MSQLFDLNDAISEATASTESIIYFYPEFIHQLSQPSVCTPAYITNFIHALRKIVGSKSSSPLQKFYSVYLLLRTSDLPSKETLMAQIANEDELLSEIFRVAQIDVTTDTLPNERGKTYFGKSTKKQEFGINFVRLCYECIIHWGSKYGTSDSKNPLHIYQYLAETLKKKGKLPFRYYFVDKNYDLSYNIPTWDFKDHDPGFYKANSMEIPAVPNKLKKTSDSSPTETSTANTLSSLIYIPLDDTHEDKSTPNGEPGTIKGNKMLDFLGKPQGYPESLDYDPESTPGFGRQKDLIGQREGQQDWGKGDHEVLEQPRTPFERKAYGGAFSETKQRCQDEGVSLVSKGGYSLSVIPVSGLDEEDKSKQKKYEKELMGIQNLIVRHSPTKNRVSSPGNVWYSVNELSDAGSQQGGSERNSTKVLSNPDEDCFSCMGMRKGRISYAAQNSTSPGLKKLEMMQRMEQFDKERFGDNFNKRRVRNNTLQPRDAYNNVSLGFKQKLEVNSLANLDQEYISLKSIPSLNDDKKLSSEILQEEGKPKKYDPFSKMSLTDVDYGEKVGERRAEIEEDKERRCENRGHSMEDLTKEWSSQGMKSLDERTCNVPEGFYKNLTEKGERKHMTLQPKSQFG